MAPPVRTLGLAAGAVLALGLILLAALRGENAPAEGGGARGVDLAALKAVSFDGRPASLEPFRGKTVVVNFWAAWCEPCRREMASLECLSRLVAPEAAVVIGVSYDADRNLARELLLAQRVTFPNLSDPGGAASAARLGVVALPETLIFRPDGTLAGRVRGARDWSDPALAARYRIPLEETPGVTLTACSREDRG